MCFGVCCLYLLADYALLFVLLVNVFLVLCVFCCFVCVICFAFALFYILACLVEYRLVLVFSFRLCFRLLGLCVVVVFCLFDFGWFWVAVLLMCL